jgi:DMSO/TMAO reductase YedYZ heme-binding membrane subunit
MNDSLLWYAARSTGMVAWALAAASVIWGLLLSTRSARGLAKPAWVLDLHRFLGLLTLVMTAAHLAALVGDNYVHFDAADLFVPGASSWKTAPVAWGVIAFWAFLAVEVTSLAKKRIAHRTWARVHLLSFVAYILATAHYLQAGTERTNPIVLLSVEAVSALVVFLTMVRILVPRRQQIRAAATTRSTARPATPPSGHFPAPSAGK